MLSAGMNIIPIQNTTEKRGYKAHYWSCNFSYIKDGYFNHAASVTELRIARLQIKIKIECSLRKCHTSRTKEG